MLLATYTSTVRQHCPSVFPHRPRVCPVHFEREDGEVAACCDRNIGNGGLDADGDSNVSGEERDEIATREREIGGN